MCRLSSITVMTGQTWSGAYFPMIEVRWSGVKIGGGRLGDSWIKTEVTGRRVLVGQQIIFSQESSVSPPAVRQQATLYQVLVNQVLDKRSPKPPRWLDTLCFSHLLTGG